MSAHMSSPQQQQQSQQPWSPDQRRQQIAELLRNKGVICRDFLYTSRCPRTPTCPYMHVANGETRPVPWSVCTFFTQGKCLRDRCTFFHGSQAQLEELHATGSPVYRPQDYMKIAVPPAEYLNPDGSIATNIAFSAVPPPQPTMQVMRGPAMPHDNNVNAFQPVVLMQQSPQSIASPMFSGQGNTPNSSTTQYSFYSNAPLAPAQMPVQSAATVFQQNVQPMQAATYYQGNSHPQQHPPQQQQQQQYGSSATSQYNIPQHHQQHHQQMQQQPQQQQQHQQQPQHHHQQLQQQRNSQQPQQQMGNPVYFHIQQQ